MNNRFADTCRRYVGFWFESNPTLATSDGVHTYDSSLENLDKDSRAENRRKMGEYLTEFESFDADNGDLSGADRLDLQIVKSALRVSTELEDNYRRIIRDATIYPDICLWSIYSILMREYAPLEQRMKAVADRLAEVPRVLNEGMQNLGSADGVPAAWTRMGMEVTNSGMAFLASVVPVYASKVTGLHNDVIKANNEAVLALSAYSQWLQGELMPRSNGDFRLGEEMFNSLVKHEYMLPHTCDDLIELGKDEIESTRRALSKAAAEIDANRHWEELIADFKSETPSAEGLLDYYRNEMERARRFVTERDLVDLPTDADLQIVETPEFQRGRYPYAGYVTPPAFESRQDGLFWVTPVDTSLPAEVRAEQLSGHSKAAVTLKAIHEGYPGHHLQFAYSNRVSTDIRKLFTTSVFTEGWALYCEEMMYEQGYFDLRARLFQLKDQLWRACRVLIDVELHRGNMSFQDAVRMLVDVAGLEEINAISEVKRYTQSPAQPMSYTVGKRALLKLRDDFRSKNGSVFDLKSFHNRVLSFGSIPIGLIAEEML